MTSYAERQSNILFATIGCVVVGLFLLCLALYLFVPGVEERVRRLLGRGR